MFYFIITFNWKKKHRETKTTRFTIPKFTEHWLSPNLTNSQIRVDYRTFVSVLLIFPASVKWAFGKIPSLTPCHALIDNDDYLPLLDHFNHTSKREIFSSSLSHLPSAPFEPPNLISTGSNAKLAYKFSADWAHFCGSRRRRSRNVCNIVNIELNAINDIRNSNGWRTFSQWILWRYSFFSSFIGEKCHHKY